MRFQRLPDVPGQTEYRQTSQNKTALPSRPPFADAERIVRDGCTARGAHPLKPGDFRLHEPGWNELPDWPRPYPTAAPAVFGRQPNPDLVHCINAIVQQALWVNSRSLGCWLKGPDIAPIPGTKRKERLLENLGGLRWT